LIDLKNETVRRITDPHGIATNANGIITSRANAPVTHPVTGVVYVPANGGAGTGDAPFRDKYWKYDPATGELEETSVTSTYPNYTLCRNYKHSFAYCSIDGKIYYRANRNGAIIRFDPVTRVAERATALNGSGKLLWMTHDNSLDCPDCNSVAPNLNGSGNPDSYLAFDPNHPNILWVSLSTRHIIARMDIQTGEWDYYGNGIAYSLTLPNTFIDGELTKYKSMFNEPRQITFDNRGNLIVTDKGGHRLRKIDVSQMTATTIAGTGTAGTAPDGVIAKNATLRQPSGVACAKDGTVYFIEAGNMLLRKLVFE
jgi:hypothetical protein